MGADTATPGPGGFRALAGEESGVWVVDLRGDIDIATVPQLARILDVAIARDESVILDLAGVEFIDSTGLRELIRAHGRVTAQGRRLAVTCQPPAAAARLISLTGLGTLFELHPTRSDAVARLRG